MWQRGQVVLDNVPGGRRVAEFDAEPFSVVFELRYTVGEEKRRVSHTVRCEVDESGGTGAP